MSKDFRWPDNPPSMEPSTNSYLWYVTFIFMFIVLANVIIFLPSVIAMAFPQLDFSWIFAQ